MRLADGEGSPGMADQIGSEMKFLRLGLTAARPVNDHVLQRISLAEY